MVYSCVEGPPAANSRKRCPPTLALLVALAAGGCVESQAAVHASAAIVSTHHPGHGASIQSFGNGRYNKNAFLINSTTSDRAVQGVRNAGAGGRIINMQAFCKRKLRCKLTQRAAMFLPW